jgi:hypothetical protein
MISLLKCNLHKKSALLMEVLICRRHRKLSLEICGVNTKGDNVKLKLGLVEKDCGQQESKSLDTNPSSTFSQIFDGENLISTLSDTNQR